MGEGLNAYTPLRRLHRAIQVEDQGGGPMQLSEAAVIMSGALGSDRIEFELQLCDFMSWVTSANCLSLSEPLIPYP